MVCKNNVSLTAGRVAKLYSKPQCFSAAQHRLKLQHKLLLLYTPSQLMNKSRWTTPLSWNYPQGGCLAGDLQKYGS